MDLIYTDAQWIEQGIINAYALDLSFGTDEYENDFELTIGKSDPALETNAVVYIDGTEYGGMIGGVRASTDSDSITYTGRTWHGILNSKVIQPDAGEDYLVVSGDANDVLALLIDRLDLPFLFAVEEGSVSGITIDSYQFDRYCKGYDGIRKMLEAHGAKLNISCTWITSAIPGTLITRSDWAVYLSAVPIVDYTETPLDGDDAPFTVERNDIKVNHLICLGQGELADREVIHLYVDQFGRIGSTQYYARLDEVVDVYDAAWAESSDELRKGGISKLNELRNNDTAEVHLSEDAQQYDIGDIVGATDVTSGITVSSAVTQKIVRIKNGVISTEYKTGG